MIHEAGGNIKWPAHSEQCDLWCRLGLSTGELGSVNIISFLIISFEVKEMLLLSVMTSISSSPSYFPSVTIWESCWAQKCDPCCLWMSGDELKHNGMKLAQLPIWGIQWVWCANTIVSITSLTVSSCPDVFMDPQRSSAKYNQCKIASEQNHLTVFRLITGEAWMYRHGSMFQSTASWQSSPLSWSPMSGLTSEVITQVLGEWIGLERRNSSQPVTGTSS